MSEPGSRVARWFCVFADLGRMPLAAVPERALIEELRQDFPAAVSSHHRREAGAISVAIDPVDAIDSVTTEFEGWEQGTYDDHHPLLTWHAVTQDLRPWTNARVPTTMVSQRMRAFYDGLTRPLGLNQQLSIGYRFAGIDHRAFLVARGGRDFDDEDLLVASFVQRGLLALDAQTSLLARLQQPADPLDSSGLTGRELAVLQLLVDGHSTRVIGRRLRCSPRTVEKHLEHVFRKLEVRDRVNAVRVAQARGLSPSPPDQATGDSSSGSSTPTSVDDVLIVDAPGTTRNQTRSP